MENIQNLSTSHFIKWLVSKNIMGGYIFNLYNEYICSKNLPKNIIDLIVKNIDYDMHEGFIFQIDEEYNAIFVVAIHKTIRGNAQGGTRLKAYNTIQCLFNDALRLSKGMTEKSSLAELWWGGGKSIIHVENPQELTGKNRTTLLKRFAHFVASLNGVYVCAEDMNTTPEDMKVIHSENRFCTCIPKANGGSSNPSSYTAKGVFKGLLAGIHFLKGIYNKDENDLTGVRVLVEGAGNVGFNLINLLVENNAKVFVYEINEDKIKKLKKHFPLNNVIIKRDKDTFYSIKADVFSPNAIGATVNATSIRKLNVAMIAGGANNQLAFKSDAQLLHDERILYVPDFVINCIGIINCSNEQYGYVEKSIKLELEKIYHRTYQILEESTVLNKSPQFVAIEKANKLSQIPHPIFGHRGRSIIEDILKNNLSFCYNS